MAVFSTGVLLSGSYNASCIHLVSTTLFCFLFSVVDFLFVFNHCNLSEKFSHFIKYI